jgi:molybdenum cofactor cytidylyltransferase
VAAIVLAAGRARRFGAQKLLAPFGGGTVLRSVVERLRASNVTRIVVVTGDRADELRAALAGLDVEWAANPNPARGMSSSIVAGLGAVRGASEAALIALGDQPTIDTSVVDRMIDLWQSGNRPVVAPRCKRGNPVLFDRALFEELQQLEGDRGARDFLEAHAAHVGVVDVDALPPLDVDTPGDYDTLLRATRGA